jgi:hypothetical protein
VKSETRSGLASSRSLLRSPSRFPICLRPIRQLDAPHLARNALGFAQMTAAAFALALVAIEGMTSRALIAAVLALSLTMTSMVLYGGRLKP